MLLSSCQPAERAGDRLTCRGVVWSERECADVGPVGEQHEQREEEEGERALPHLHDIGAPHQQDKSEPHVREHLRTQATSSCRRWQGHVTIIT